VVTITTPDGPPNWDVSELELSTEHENSLLAFMQENYDDWPVELPEPLLQIDKRPTLLTETINDDGDGNLALRLSVANPYAVPLTGGLVCVQDWRQVSCSDDAEAFDVDLPAWTATQRDMTITGASEDTVYYAFLLLEDDRRSVESTSIARLVLEPTAKREELDRMASVDPYRIDPMTAGCGFGAFYDGRAPNELGNPFVLDDMVSRRDEVSLVYAACDDHAAVWMMPLLFRNRAELLNTEWSATPFSWDDWMQLPVPASVLEDPATTSLQMWHIIHEDGLWLDAPDPEVRVID
jgi:hypothetical protein